MERFLNSLKLSRRIIATDEKTARTYSAFITSVMIMRQLTQLLFSTRLKAMIMVLRALFTAFLIFFAGCRDRSSQSVYQSKSALDCELEIDRPARMNDACLARLESVFGIGSIRHRKLEAVELRECLIVGNQSYLVNESDTISFDYDVVRRSATGPLRINGREITIQGNDLLSFYPSMGKVVGCYVVKTVGRKWIVVAYWNQHATGLGSNFYHLNVIDIDKVQGVTWQTLMIASRYYYDPEKDQLLFYANDYSESLLDGYMGTCMISDMYLIEFGDGKMNILDSIPNYQCCFPDIDSSVHVRTGPPAATCRPAL